MRITSGATPPPGRMGPLDQVQPSEETSPPPRVPKVYHLPSDSTTVDGSWMKTSPASCAVAGADHVKVAAARAASAGSIGERLIVRPPPHRGSAVRSHPAAAGRSR